MEGTVLCTANHAPLTPISFLERAALVYPDRPAVVVASGPAAAPPRNWRETRARCLRLAAALAGLGVERHDVVLDEPDVPAGHPYHEYEALLRSAGGGSPDFSIRWPADENEPIALNYTSGTTSRPKGVVYRHRGAYLNAFACVLLNDMTATPVYLWTVPMFHCNVCLRKVSPAAIFDSVARARHGVTHMGGAPTVLSMIVNAKAEERRPLPGGRRVTVETGGAPPPPEVLFRMEDLGFVVVHSYGLTETYGSATVCTWKPEWDALPAAERAAIKSRQGLHHLGLEVDVKDPVTVRSVPADGRTMGEVMFRGNTVMSGYYKDAAATAEAMAGGWLRSGDLAVRHGDGYVKILDRSKDIIISGGENISTIEVEAALFAHPAFAEGAVVGRPDEYWGETPCAFVTLKDGAGESVGAEEVMAFCRARLPHYMAPRTVVIVAELPKMATGKVQKCTLRERAKAMGNIAHPRPRSRSSSSSKQGGSSTVVISLQAQPPNAPQTA
ncbi:hypothetical protein C2845_PM06G10760 [Panicum miliaceum]|uniref:4-coumarate--CoA ligase n=1 Tax=Panicum miliaceum TaxID=4540 RepID=A0A3L6RDT5_PANMI|nr:hypothetical protein C2845_PM06G10760 [Panicum miliaceum]